MNSMLAEKAAHGPMLRIGCRRIALRGQHQPFCSSSSPPSSSSLLTLGAGCFGALGDGTYDSHYDTPHRIDAMQVDANDLAAIEAGWADSYALSRSGELWQWGWPLDLQQMFFTSTMARRAPNLLATLQSLPFGWMSLNSATTSPTPLIGKTRPNPVVASRPSLPTVFVRWNRAG